MAKATGIDTIARKELRWRMDRAEPLVLIDTLPEEDYREGHLPGAVNVPSDRIAELVPELFPDRAAEIVLYGAGTDDSECVDAALELAALGYPTVRVYHGGKKDWVEHGQPMEATVVQSVDWQDIQRAAGAGAGAVAAVDLPTRGVSCGLGGLEAALALPICRPLECCVDPAAGIARQLPPLRRLLLKPRARTCPP